ncbi:hypothetical protein [Nocardia acidivorans]|uniref:hypothetical protein n=1 Tax=Nocardia acidivorans TaxID=404580 RepID=UPI00082F18F2|nr:hypothetical protein [Nocardia acidivorans]
MPDILDVLHARAAEVAGEAILTGEKHPTLTLTTGEVADLLNHIAAVHRRYGDLNNRHRSLGHLAKSLQRALVTATRGVQK